MLITPSLLIAAASGSVGDVVHSRNQFGPYVRNRTIPTDPQTGRQLLVRQRFATIMLEWRTILTETQRQGWKTYAQNLPITNALGQLHHLTPLQMFVRCNLARTQQTMMLVMEPPTIFNNGSYGLMDVTSITQIPPRMTITFDDTDAWTTESGSAILIWASPGQLPTVNFYKGPFRAGVQIRGAPESPPTSPTTVSSILLHGEGARVFVRMLVSRADGRLGHATIANAITTRF